MKLIHIPKILAISFILIGLIDFIFFFFTFNPNYEVLGFFTLIVGVPLGLLTLLTSVYFTLKSTNTSTKRALKQGSYSIILGFFICVLLMWSYSKISKYSRLVIKNDSNLVIEDIRLVSLTNLNSSKRIKKIDIQNTKTVFLNKYKNHKWRLDYHLGKFSKNDSVEYYRVFNSVSNDTLIITQSGLIAKMYELR